MRLRSTYLSLSLTVLCSFGCSSSGGGGTIFSPGADLAGVTGPSPGGFSLTVQQAQIESSLQGTMPASGREFLVLSVQLQNDSQPTSIVANPAFFTVETASALQVSASASTSLAMTPCRSDLAVAAGGRLLCDLVFELPTAETAKTLSYIDDKMRTASAPVPAATVAPFTLASGTYHFKTRVSSTDGCNANFPDIQALMVTVNGSQVNVLINGNPTITITLMNNTGTVTLPPAMSTAPCPHTSTNTYTLTMTADDQFDFQIKVDRQYTAPCNGLTSCEWTITDHYGP